MEERLWTALGRRHGVQADDRATWEVPLRTGLQPLRTHAVFRPIGGPALCGALDDLIGEGRWEVPRHWGQFLVSFPASDGEMARSRPMWHTDFPCSMPADRVAGALVLSFLGEVPARTGGTLVLAGSPGLVAGFLREHPRLTGARMKVARRQLMATHPGLASLGTLAGPGWADEAVSANAASRDLEVVELSGEPGDVVIGHPWLLHSPSPNRGDRPRFMRVQRIRPAAQPPSAR